MLFRSNVAIAYIYCNYKEQALQTASNLITCVLKQLVQDHSVAYENVRSFYNRHKDAETHPTIMNTLEVLQSVTRLFSRVFVIVDALDECSDGTRAEFLPALQSLGNIVNLLVTSRDIPAIARDFQDNKPLDIRANSADVRRYIEGRIPQLLHLRIHVNSDAGLREEIVEAIIGSVDGMLVSYLLLPFSIVINILQRFLLARFHMDMLETTTTVREVRKALMNLPKDISNIYDETTKRVERQGENVTKLAKRIISWIIFYFRQLTLDELQHVLAVQWNTPN